MTFGSFVLYPLTKNSHWVAEIVVYKNVRMIGKKFKNVTNINNFPVSMYWFYDPFWISNEGAFHSVPIRKDKLEGSSDCKFWA